MTASHLRGAGLVPGASAPGRTAHRESDQDAVQRAAGREPVDERRLRDPDVPLTMLVASDHAALGEAS